MTYQDFVRLNGEIEVVARPEEHRPDWDLTEAETAAILDEAEWNVWAWCCVEVRLRILGAEFSEYLGGCSYADEEDFCTPGGYYDDMCATVRAEAVDWLRDLKERLQEVTG